MQNPQLRLHQPNAQDRARREPGQQRPLGNYSLEALKIGISFCREKQTLLGFTRLLGTLQGLPLSARTPVRTPSIAGPAGPPAPSASSFTLSHPFPTLSGSLLPQNPVPAPASAWRSPPHFSTVNLRSTLASSCTFSEKSCLISLTR